MSAAPPIVVQHRVPADHPAFAGHFPGRPILPGVLLLAEVLQALHHSGVAPGAVEIGAAKFLAPVGPGALLTITLQPGGRGGWHFDVDADGRRCASGKLQAGGTALPHR